MTTTTKVNVLKLLERTDAILDGHFELSSGLHSSQYFQCAKLLQYPLIAKNIGLWLAELFEEEIDTVIGPALGGIIISYEVARALGKKSIFAERKDGVLCLRRGFEISEGERVLIVEDVITTAKSVLETAEIVLKHGGRIVGMGCIIDRSQNQLDLNIKSLIQMEPNVYEPADCPLCQQGIKLEKPGSRVNIESTKNSF